MAGPIRSNDTERTCSAYAFDSTLNPAVPAAKRTWKAKTHEALLLIRTIVTTPPPSRSAAALAPSLLTSTASRRLSASLPRAGSRSRSTRRTSPRRTEVPVAGGCIPRRTVGRRFPLLPGGRMVIAEIGAAQQGDRQLDTGRSRRRTSLVHVLVENCSLGETLTPSFTSWMLPS